MKLYGILPSIYFGRVGASIETVMRLRLPKQITINQCLLSRIELVRLILLSTFELCVHVSASAAKIAVAVVQLPLYPFVKDVTLRVALIDSASHLAHASKLALAMLCIPLGLIRPEWSVSLYQRLSLVNKPKGRFAYAIEQLNKAAATAWASPSRHRVIGTALVITALVAGNYYYSWGTPVSVPNSRTKGLFMAVGAAGLVAVYLLNKLCSSKPQKQTTVAQSQRAAQPAIAQSQPAVQAAVSQSQPTVQAAVTRSQPVEQPAVAQSQPVEQPAIVQSQPEAQAAITPSQPEAQPAIAPPQPAVQAAVSLAQSQPQAPVPLAQTQVLTINCTGLGNPAIGSPPEEQQMEWSWDGDGQQQPKRATIDDQMPGLLDNEAPPSALLEQPVVQSAARTPYSELAARTVGGGILAMGGAGMALGALPLSPLILGAGAITAGAAVIGTRRAAAIAREKIPAAIGNAVANAIRVPVSNGDKKIARTLKRMYDVERNRIATEIGEKVQKTINNILGDLDNRIELPPLLVQTKLSDAADFLFIDAEKILRDQLPRVVSAVISEDKFTTILAHVKTMIIPIIEEHCTQAATHAVQSLEDQLNNAGRTIDLAWQVGEKIRDRFNGIATRGNPEEHKVPNGEQKNQ